MKGKGALCAQAVFFDMDGTIVDTEMLWAEAMVDYLADNGHTADSSQIVAIVYGHAWSAIYRQIVALYPPMGTVSMSDMALALRAYYIRLRDRGNIAIPESVACLRRLAGVYPVAIVSGSPRMEIADTIRLLGIGDEVSFYIGSEDYEHGKPDPACYLLAAARLGAAPARCVVIEDSQAGVRSARAAGMPCVALVLEGALPQAVREASLLLPTLAGFGSEEVERLVQNG